MKETKELVNGLVDLSCEIIASAKSNGLGADDAIAIVTKYASNEKFRTSINEAVKDSSKCLDEIKNAGVAGTLELAFDFATVQLPKIQAAMKG